MSDGRTDTHPAAPVNFEHYCEHPECQRWGSFGYSVTKESAPRWFCGEHRPAQASHATMQPSAR